MLTFPDVTLANAFKSRTTLREILAYNFCSVDRWRCWNEMFASCHENEIETDYI